jgi:peptidoglycan lytic transglycosylase G
VKRLVTAVVLLAVVGFGSSRAYDWWNFNVNTPVSTTSQQVVFHIDPGELPSQVTDDLLAQRLIRDRTAFDLYLRFTGAGTRFEAGSFVLNRNMTMGQIAAALQHGSSSQVSVTLREGYPLREEAKSVEQSGLGKAADYLTIAADPSWSGAYDFLGSRPAGANPPLEGYLFPDTYLVDQGNVRSLVKAQLDQFGIVFTPALRAQIAQAAAGRPAETVEAIVILASMVDREANAKNGSDRGNVCSVYYNRLNAGMPLGVDATLLYALGRLTPEPTAAELQLDSPFNTRTHSGLPPGPISNPGKAAIMACINPPQTSFFYYFTDRNGVTHFEVTEQDFYRDIQTYGLSGS